MYIDKEHKLNTDEILDKTVQFRDIIDIDTDYVIDRKKKNYF